MTEKKNEFETIISNLELLWEMSEHYNLTKEQFEILDELIRSTIKVAKLGLKNQKTK